MILESGSYLKTSDAKQGDVILFKSEGEWVENNKYAYDDGNPRQDFVIKVLHAGAEKKFRMNKTNRNNMVAAYGKDTAAWINQPARLTKENVMISGKKMETIVLVVSGAANPDQVPF